MNYAKLGKLIVEYYEINPIDKSDRYYEYENGISEGENNVKEYIKENNWKQIRITRSSLKSILKECEQ